MQPQEFLAAVLPSSGLYCAAELTTKKRQHVFVDSLEALDNASTLFDVGNKSAYFALSSFREEGSREAQNAQAIRSLFIDIDCGDGKAYPTKRAAAEALHGFLTATGLVELGNPWMVDSGGGVHAYWPLGTDATIAEWKPVAEAFKRTAKANDLRIDMTVTADAARVLRIPGTHNYKYDPPRLVKLVNVGGVFSLKDIAGYLGVQDVPPVRAPFISGIEGTPLRLPGTPPTGIAKALVQNTTTLFKNILVKTVAGTGCGQLAHYISNAKDDGLEPLWRGMLSIAKPCDDGYKAATKLSAMHPYDQERMDRKWNEIKGPYPCTKFDSENPGICGTCQHWGKITNPLALGRVNQLETTEKTYTTEEGAPPHPADHLTRPIPPRGFSFGAKGGVYMHKKETAGDETIEREVMLLPFDFFMVDVLQDGASYVARFAAVREKSLVYVVLPTRAVASKDEVSKVLSAQNIIAAFGSGNDKHLYDYVRACVSEASVTDSALRVPPTLGWQPDGSYAIADQIIQPGGPGYTYVSDRLTNIISVTSTRGTLGDWQRVLQMLQDKGQWGVVALGCIGFGSPLMQWTDDGTPGVVFHACGRQSGAGKSLALALCASVWGSPSQYPVKPTTSERTMLQRAGLLGSNPFCVDEITSNSRKSEMEWLPNFVFDFSQGGHKIKGSGSANTELANDLYWRSIALVTSNAPAMEHMMGARETSSEGEAKRLLEWRVEDKLSWTDTERAILPLLGQNYGHAGRKYAKWLVENQSTARQVLADTLARWRKLLRAEDSERYWTSGCAAILAGAILAGPAYANVCTIATRPLYEFLKNLVVEARFIIMSNQQRAEDVLNAYTRDFHGQFVKISPVQNGIAVFADGREIRPDSTKGKIAGRVEYEVNPGWVDYYIEVNMLKRFCSVRNWSYLDFQKQLALNTDYLVVECQKDLLARTKGFSLRVKCLKVSKKLGTEEESI